MKTLISLNLFILFLSSSAFAFPEMITHGYVTCITCHVSPSGGGVLTPYGKSLSQELISSTYFIKSKTEDSNANSADNKNEEATASEENEDELGPPPSPWLVGADVRLLEMYLNNEFETKTVFIPMQFEAEVAHNQKSWALVARAGITAKTFAEGGEGDGPPTIGGHGPEADEGSSGNPLAKMLPTYYGLFRWGHSTFRAGQFLPNYGLNNSLHILNTRGNMGFGFEDQRLGTEISYHTNEFSVIAAAFGPRGPESLGENATTMQVQFSPIENSRLALNYWKESDLRTLIGTWFVLPVTESFSLIADYNEQTEYGSKGNYLYAKFRYEIDQGLNVYAFQDRGTPVLQHPFTVNQKTGIGVQFFPISGLEFDAIYAKEINGIYSYKAGDYAYLLMHYYL